MSRRAMLRGAALATTAAVAEDLYGVQLAWSASWPPPALSPHARHPVKRECDYSAGVAVGVAQCQTQERPSDIRDEVALAACLILGPWGSALPARPVHRRQPGAVQRGPVPCSKAPASCWCSSRTRYSRDHTPAACYSPSRRPAGLTAATQFLRHLMPLDARAQRYRDPIQSCAVRGPRPTTSRLGRLPWQQLLDCCPLVVGNQESHVP